MKRILSLILCICITVSTMTIVASAVGGLPEVVLDEKTGYLVPPEDDEALGKAVIRFFRDTDVDSMKENIKKGNLRKQ